MRLINTNMKNIEKDSMNDNKYNKETIGRDLQNAEIEEESSGIKQHNEKNRYKFSGNLAKKLLNNSYNPVSQEFINSLRA